MLTTKYERIKNKMTEPTNPERGAEQPSEGLPIPKLESPSPVSSPSSVDIDAIVQQVSERIQRDLRMAQSKKDKNAELVKKTMGITDLSELEEMGAQIPDNVKLEYRLRQIEGHRTPDNSPVQQPSSPGNGAALTAQDVSEVVKQFNLDANNADVIEALRGTYRNRDHFEATLAKLALKPKQPASPTESSSLRSQPASMDKAADIERGYLEAIAKVPRGNTHMVSQVKAEWRKKAREAGFNLNV